MRRCLSNCLGVAMFVGTSRLSRVAVFLMALATYYKRVHAQGNNNHLVESLLLAKKGDVFRYCVSMDTSTGTRNLAYLEPEDLWFGIPVSCQNTKRADMYGNLAVISAHTGTVLPIYESVVCVRPAPQYL